MHAWTKGGWGQWTRCTEQTKRTVLGPRAAKAEAVVVLVLVLMLMTMSTTRPIPMMVTETV